MSYFSILFLILAFVLRIQVLRRTSVSYLFIYLFLQLFQQHFNVKKTVTKVAKELVKKITTKMTRLTKRYHYALA